MAIGHHIKIIGRGRESARALTRADAADLFGQVLDGSASDLEIGAFCIAMRIKGETAEEMAGFLDATESRLHRVTPDPCTPAAPLVVLPSYNGARRLPLLTPLLALLLARAGFAVLMHGTATEARRTATADVLAALGIAPCQPHQAWAGAGVRFVPTAWLHPGLQRLLEVRSALQLRNPAHSLVKLLQPAVQPGLLVSSYTHPEYAQSMTDVLLLRQHNALLLRGTEGEAVADARRVPAMRSLVQGHVMAEYVAQSGTLTTVPDLPGDCAAESTARYIESVLADRLPLPDALALQVQRIVELHRAAQETPTHAAL